MKVNRIAFDPAKLRAARLAAFPAMSQAEVAATVFGWNRQRLNGYENGHNNPDPHSLAKMCKAYNVDLLKDLTDESDDEQDRLKAA